MLDNGEGEGDGDGDGAFNRTESLDGPRLPT